MWPAGTKLPCINFFLSTGNPVLTGERVSPYNGVQVLIFEIINGCFSTEFFEINHLLKTKLNHTLYLL